MKKKNLWIMPKWMGHYTKFMAEKSKKRVENIVNDEGIDGFRDPTRCLKRHYLDAQVLLLLELHKNDLLKG